MPTFAGFIGPAYAARAFQADAEDSINWYPEAIESPGGRTKTSYSLLSKPGFRRFASVSGALAIRAECALNQRGFFIAQTGASNFFYELHRDGTKTSYGAIAGDRRPQIVPGLTQLLILAGGLGYIFDLKANTLTRILDPDFPIGATKGGFLDAFFIVLEPHSQTFAISALNDGTSWDPLDFSDVEGEPGNITTFVVDHRQLWFLGNNHSEIYVNSGNALFPFVRLEGAYMEQGAGESIDGAFRCDNTTFWLGGNADGQGVFWRANGYTPQRISTHAIEKLVASFGGDLSRVSSYPYQEEGHTFARWDFPDAYAGRGASLLYDCAGGAWHRRAFWNATLGQYMGDLARTHMFVWGKHLVGDWRSGSIYEQSMDYFSDAGAAIRRLRAGPDLANGGKWTFYPEFRLLMDVGVGLDGGGLAPPPGALYELHSYFFPTLATNNFFNAETNDPEPWYLCSINSQSTLGAVPVTLSITADGVTYGPWTIAPGHTVLIYPPIAVRSTDTWTVSSTSVWLHFNASAGNADLSGFLVSSAHAGGPVTIVNRGTASAQMILWLADYGGNAGGFAARIPFPGPTSVSLDNGAILTNDLQFAIMPWADTLSVTAFTTPTEGSAEWVSIAPYSAGIPEGGAPAGDGTNPQIILQWSNDGGKTWSAERPAPAGKIGDYKRLVRWRQTPRSNNRCFRVIYSEPTDASLVAADIDTEAGS